MGKQLAHRLRELYGFFLGLGCGYNTGQVRAAGRAIDVAFFDDYGVIGHLHPLVSRLGRMSLCRRPRDGAGVALALSLLAGDMGCKMGFGGLDYDRKQQSRAQDLGGSDIRAGL